jgi:signal transduction histidine kinase
MPRSIIGWFVICWSAFLLASVVVGVLLLSLYRQTATEQVRRATAAVAHGCDAIASRYQLLAAGSTGPPPGPRASEFARGMTRAVATALRDLPGVEGGIWQTEQGSLAYAFPTYQGTGEKTDLPPAEEPQIRELAEASARDGVPVDMRHDAQSQVLLLHACPLTGPSPLLSAWTMARVVTAGGRSYIEAMAGLGVLLVVVLGSAAGLGLVLLGWMGRVRRLEAALDTGVDELLRLDPTGQRDLDRIIDAINRAGGRLADARREAEALARQVAESQRLATLGRVVAGVAHEIRNPIAAMRLKAENAIAAGHDIRRKDQALRTIIDQIGRLEGLLRNLLSSVQRAKPMVTPVRDVIAFLNERVDFFREQTAAHGLAVKVEGRAIDAAFDPARIGQAVDNLVLNAIQNTPPAGCITVSAGRSADRLVLSVADTGRGVPKDLRAQLFEPFVTARPDGTGLGLAVVREIAEAHGGTARAIHRPDGTTFIVELPWQPS